MLKEIKYPILEGKIDGTPFHSSQYSVLPEIYVQNASLEIAWTKVPFSEQYYLR